MNAKHNWKIGDEGYINVSNVKIVPVTVAGISSDFLTLRFIDEEGGTRLRKSRVFHTRSEAEEALPASRRQDNKENKHSSPW